MSGHPQKVLLQPACALFWDQQLLPARWHSCLPAAQDESCNTPIFCTVPYCVKLPIPISKQGVSSYKYIEHEIALYVRPILPSPNVSLYVLPCCRPSTDKNPEKQDSKAHCASRRSLHSTAFSLDCKSSKKGKRELLDSRLGAV